ncbi:rhodanese-like domain-containing protein [Thiovibrio frasassiensis]|uniref:Rhodanese-like domain-containing protein n=1 Tax=Thiovibrio frasassiensis TaxID=2984131 RepID=A0A9X4MF85_9BACT|nr:rhodanese-like domain-containing protein [Thiovibrio frasassiensis]MDG4475557.1 rhodanese-like domain-containing protein [Thiovibrio frasassiensis]
MKRYLHLSAVLILLLLTAACSDHNPPENQEVPAGSEAPPIFRSLSPPEAKALIESRKDLVLVDVRSPQELNEGSIAGSQLMPFGELAQGRMTLPTGQPLLLICAVGGRSYAVGQYFSGKGYGEIYNLGGGISAWKGAGLPLQSR